MKHFAYLLAILTAMFIASSTKAEHKDLFRKADVQRPSDDHCQPIKKLLDAGVCVKHAMQFDVEIVNSRPHKF